MFRWLRSLRSRRRKQAAFVRTMNDFYERERQIDAVIAASRREAGVPEEEIKESLRHSERTLSDLQRKDTLISALIVGLRS